MDNKNNVLNQEHKEFKQRDRRIDKTEGEESNFLKNIKEIFGNDFSSLILSETKKDYNSYLEKIKNFTKNIKDDITTSQLRNVYYEVKKSKKPEDIYLLRPKFAYTSGRSDKSGLKKFLYLLDILAKQIKSENQLEEFKNFFESIISYHKYFGGKD